MAVQLLSMQTTCETLATRAVVLLFTDTLWNAWKQGQHTTLRSLRHSLAEVPELLMCWRVTYSNVF